MRMTRRELGQAAAAAALASKVVAAAPEAHPAAVRSESKVQELDPVEWTLNRYRSAPLQLTFRATTRAEAEQWQRQLRAKLTELLGGFPERTPLTAQTLDKRDLTGYTREKIFFESRPGNGVILYLLLPARSPAPHPTVICVPGHGRGVDDRCRGHIGLGEQIEVPAGPARRSATGSSRATPRSRAAIPRRASPP